MTFSGYSLWDFLETALRPVGQTMYIWGGGWNEEDTAAGIEAVSIGLNAQWEKFYQVQNSLYNYNHTRYQIHDGLDCSGYVGWVLYNLFHEVDGGNGYVMHARKMAKNFAERGWGTYTPAASVRDYCPGDIMSSKGHVYIVLGACDDGSVLVVHSSPPGVQINGTVDRNGREDSQAAKLAEQYMKNFYPNWYKRYKTKVLDSSFLRIYSQMRWSFNHSSMMTDSEGMQQKKAADVMRLLFRVPFLAEGE